MLNQWKALTAVLVGTVLAGCQSDRCCLIGSYVESASTSADTTPIPAKESGQSSEPSRPIVTPPALDSEQSLDEPLPLPLPVPGIEPTARVSRSRSESLYAGWRPSRVEPVSFQQSSDAAPDGTAASQSTPVVSDRPSNHFKIPPDLPGADASPLRLPAYDKNQSFDQRRSLIQSLFPKLPYDMTSQSAVDRNESPLTLAELQQLGLANSPVVQQAAADVETARGKAVQVGLYPNPTIGYEGDTIGTGGTAGYNGAFLSQELITGGKLTLAQDSALLAMQATEADLRKARISLASDIRRAYFQVLLAQERLTFSHALAQLSEEVYRAQIDLVAGGENAAYEPLQLRVLAVQARNTVVQANTRVTAAWRQLAATLGVPDMTRTAVAGTIEAHAPQLDYDTARAMILSGHTDLVAANARISSAQYNLQLQEVIPIPNIELYTAFQHDDTSPVNNTSFNLQIGLPLPLYDRNQGNITSAHAQVQRSQQDLLDARNSLLNSLAEIYGRYSASVTIASSYREQILQDQVRVYRGVYDRFQQAGGSVDFAQVVVAQQTLAQAISSYLDVLGEQWAATVDLAEIVQVDDLFSMGAGLDQ
ncbi:MAG: TolC family protein [Rhodopirellula sp.]|nr:TolC family protein [Rhodopirellula sp.]